MNSLSIELFWENIDNSFLPDKYSTEHKIKINNSITYIAGSAPEFGGDVKNLNPEQSLAASVSSCHMMTFLALAAKMRWPIIKYSDKAYAYIGKNSKGKMCVNKIELNPLISFKNNFKVSSEEMNKMQNRSHRYCFIANSLSEEVEIKINT